MRFLDLGTVDFHEALRLQAATLAEIAAGGAEETVYLLEHPHVFTIGRRGRESNLLARRDFEGREISVARINRGGDITYHGPGQLVGYPLLDLRRRQRDLHRFLRDLEYCLIRTAAEFGVEAFRREGLTGVWTREGKLASIGIGVRNWITMHGFALNVATDLRYFGLINPCGIEACPVVSLEALVGGKIPLVQVKESVRGAFAQVFRETSGTPDRAISATSRG